MVHGVWSVDPIANELIQAGVEDAASIIFGDPSWSSYDLKYEAKAVAGNGSAWTFIHYQSTQNHMNFYPGFGRFQHGMGNLVAGQPARIQTNRSAPFGEWNEIRVEVRGADVRGFVNGSEVVHMEAGSFSQGLIGLGTNKTAMHFRNIEVTSPEGKVLFRGPPRLPAQ